jgi:predicted RNase H-like HicB family nuclease
MQGPTFSILSLTKGVNAMHNEFTAIVERDDNWFIAYCPEIPGANGQGRTKDECLRDLSQATAATFQFQPPNRDHIAT